MIRRITPMVEIVEPPMLLHTKQHRLHLNESLVFEQKRQRLPIIVAFISKQRLILQDEHRMARHILHRHNVNFARPLVLSFLQFSN